MPCDVALCGLEFAKNPHLTISLFLRPTISLAVVFLLAAPLTFGASAVLKPRRACFQSQAPLRSAFLEPSPDVKGSCRLLNCVQGIQPGHFASNGRERIWRGSSESSLRAGIPCCWESGCRRGMQRDGVPAEPRGLRGGDLAIASLRQTRTQHPVHQTAMTMPQCGRLPLILREPPCCFWWEV